MYIAVILFCLKANALSCLPPKTPSFEPVGLESCMAQGMEFAAQALSSEPELQGYEVRKIACVPFTKGREEHA